MSRSPLAIALAVISAILIVVARINRDATWSTPVLVAGFIVLVVAAVVAFRTRR